MIRKTIAAALAVALSACAAPAPLPEQLPHYPCARKAADGKVEYFACEAGEWLAQQILGEGEAS